MFLEVALGRPGLLSFVPPSIADTAWRGRVRRGSEEKSRRFDASEGPSAVAMHAAVRHGLR